MTDHADTIRRRFPLLYEAAQNAAQRREVGLEVQQGDGEAEALLAERRQAIDALRRIQLVPISPEGAKRAVELSERGLVTLGEQP